MQTLADSTKSQLIVLRIQATQLNSMATNYKIVNSPGNLGADQNKSTQWDSILPKWSTYGHNRNEVWVNIVQVKFTTLATKMRRFRANFWPNQRSFHAVDMHTGPRLHHEEPSKPNSTPKEYIWATKASTMLRSWKDGDEGGRPDLGYLPSISGHIRLGAQDRRRLYPVTESHHRLARWALSNPTHFAAFRGLLPT